MTQDGIELADYLRKYLKKDKIIVVCHSFGSILGLRMASAKPESFHAYVVTGQVGDSTRNYSVAYDALLAKARSLANQSAIADLIRVGPPPYKSGEGFQVQRRWANSFEGADQFLFSTLGYGLVAPGYSVEDINDSGDGQILSAEHLVPQTKSLTPKDLGLTFSIPIFVVQGAEDFTTPAALAKHYLESLEAPRKEFITIPDAGHFAVFMRPKQFLAELLKHVAPLAAP
jgi:pimeloyl-ACP methyl ester carboxylesterase